MHCSNCGDSLEATSKFCSNCGTPAANNSVPVTSQPTYSFVVTGEIVEGQILDAVKDNLEKFIKLDRKALDGIFAKKKVVLKKDIDKETAEKYKKAFTKCGAICKITENVANIIDNDKSTDSNSQPHQTKSNLPKFQDPENHSESTTAKENHSKISLWNPNAAANWFISITPKLVAYLHLKNWSKPLGIGTACLFALIVVFSITASYWDSSAGATDCDLLAANPKDSSKVSPGVDFEDLEMKKAVRACKNALKEYPSSARLMYQYGRALDKGKFYENALKWYRKAADKGYVNAMFNLGVFYQNGEFVKKDVDQALKWYRKAADKGDAESKMIVAGLESVVATKAKIVAAKAKIVANNTIVGRWDCQMTGQNGTATEYIYTFEDRNIFSAISTTTSMTGSYKHNKSMLNMIITFISGVGNANQQMRGEIIALTDKSLSMKVVTGNGNIYQAACELLDNNPSTKSATIPQETNIPQENGDITSRYILSLASQMRSSSNPVCGNFAGILDNIASNGESQRMREMRADKILDSAYSRGCI